MSKKKMLIRAGFFLLVLVLLLSGLQKVFTIGQNSAYQAETGWYTEKVGSLDGVYIGASNVHAFWEPPFAWRDHGIAVLSFSVDSMPAHAIKYMMIEARKTQPDALYIVNINTLKGSEIEVAGLHRMADYLPFSANKVAMINKLAKDAGYDGLNRLEFFFPLIRFHSRWSELTSWDFQREVNGLKMGLIYNVYFSRTEDISDQYQVLDTVEALDEDQASILEDLLAYCDSEHVKVLFVSVPQALSEEDCGQLNAIKEIVQQRGYPCLDILSMADELGILPDTDFYNASHTNVHGSVKYTEYLAQYLIAHYGFADKRGQAGWEAWDAAAVKYDARIAPYALPFELEHAKRDYGMSAPSLSAPAVEGRTITVTWEASDGAASYDVFRKQQNGPWTYCGTIDGTLLSYTDEGLKPGKKYTYTVVPVRQEGNEKIYGGFAFSGVSGTIETEEAAT